MHNSSESLLKNLQQKGERITAIRRVLVNVLEKTTRPLSVQDLLVKLKKSSIDANKTTVYRQLETLLKYNLLREIRLADRSVLYELAREDDHHHHLVCLGCGEIDDVSFKDDVERQEKNILKTKKFKVARHSLEFFGWCAHCQKKYDIQTKK